MSARVLDIADVRVSFGQADGAEVDVVRGVTLSLDAGEVIALVGESGSGKSITARAIMGLVPAGGTVSGSVRLKGEDVLAMSAERLRGLRGNQVAMVFQDPMTSFNPVRRVGAQIGEAVTAHNPTDKPTLRDKVLHALSQVGILNPKDRSRAYPDEMSGGMRQRALIAMSMINDPALLIADEPTTALDVTIQDQILDLMRDLNARSDTAILLITHNIALVANICSRMVVMYAGCVVEDGPTAAMLADPQHPYTWMLLQSQPRIDEPRDRLVAIDGQPPDPAHLPTGCKFHPRCPFAVERCPIEEPSLEAIAPAHEVRCFRPMRQAGLPGGVAP